MSTVIVCTRNRSKQLITACEAILAIDYPRDLWQLLIIDNNSTDDSLAVARAIAERYPGQVRAHVEKELGLSAARNAAIDLAEGEILAFIDDDAFPEPQWLRGLVDALAGDGALAAGGPVEPIFSAELPPWLEDRYLPYLTVWDLGPEILELRYNEYPRGANMAFRREAFERFGTFSHHLGRRGASLLSCEETELCLRIERGGGKVIYTPEARVGHQIDAGRITESWLLGRFGAQGRSEAIVDWQHGGLAGLRRGWQRFRRHAADATRATGDGSDLFRRCQASSYRAYTWSALRCPFTVPRYRPSAATGAAAPWLPFS